MIVLPVILVLLHVLCYSYLYDLLFLLLIRCAICLDLIMLLMLVTKEVCTMGFIERDKDCHG